ncbi:NAD(P)-dependent oxidoreductase [Flavobacterium croceum]|uniref:NAD(P)-dependent oxidoreductase n=1 Tax=Flavobacterium croceum TaxID=370975 RepID=UPI0024A7E31C|nr:NAD(P)-dependent oxidoreductase [Flavobacterium croceum]
MRKILVGHTGFVGSNLLESTHFDGCFNSKNIENSFGLNPELLIYSGVPAEKFLANKNPENDFLVITNAIENIKKINPKQIVLISTIDVYPSPIHVNENTIINKEMVLPYGKNRLYLEEWVENNCSNYLIVRLPGLFGKNIKKNFIFDLISIIPSMLNEQKFNELSHYDWIIENYDLQPNGFYKLKSLSTTEKNQLKNQFLKIGFSALNFTDSRGVFQFYNLSNLWSDINTALNLGIKKLNLSTEPISVSEIYENIYGKAFENYLNNPIPHYDLYTLYADKFGKKDNYIATKKEILEQIIHFIKQANL